MITFLFVLVILGCALYLVETYLPMAAPIRTVIRIVVVILIVWYLLHVIGMAPRVPM